MQTKEEVVRQHQGMDRPGVHKAPEGSEEQRKMLKTGCEIICGAPTTPAVKGLMMMMMQQNCNGKVVLPVPVAALQREGCHTGNCGSLS